METGYRETVVENDLLLFLVKECKEKNENHFA
jgi:hypothetical protein